MNEIILIFSRNSEGRFLGDIDSRETVHLSDQFSESDEEITDWADDTLDTIGQDGMLYKIFF